MSFNTNKEEFKIMTYNVLAHFATKHNELLKPTVEEDTEMTQR